MKLRILAINHESIYPPLSGYKLAVFRSLESLAKKGHEVVHFSWGMGNNIDTYKSGVRLIHKSTRGLSISSIPPWLKIIESHFFLS